MSEMKWEPIETAPKDGKQILIYWSQFPTCPFGVAYWDDSSKEWADPGDDFAWKTPTHWMPLPEPPK